MQFCLEENGDQFQCACCGSELLDWWPKLEYLNYHTKELRHLKLEKRFLVAENESKEVLQLDSPMLNILTLWRTWILCFVS